MDSRYEQIIDLPHHVSDSRPHMSMTDRAAQFSPFAALTGYGDCVSEEARLTERRRDNDEDRCAWLDRCMNILTENIQLHPEVTVWHFVEDSTKEGGAYAAKTGNVRYINSYGMSLVFTDGTEIRLRDIDDINGEIFGER